MISKYYENRTNLCIKTTKNIINKLLLVTELRRLFLLLFIKSVHDVFGDIYAIKSSKLCFMN